MIPIKTNFTTEIPIGKTLYIVTSEHSPSATETLEKKLERLILRHAADAKSYQDEHRNRVDNPQKQSHHSTTN